MPIRQKGLVKSLLTPYDHSYRFDHQLSISLLNFPPTRLLEVDMAGKLVSNTNPALPKGASKEATAPKTGNLRLRSREVIKSIRQYVLDGIESGELRADEKLPTERELTDRFGGGRSAVRQALERLERDGLIIRHVGRGTFLAPTVGKGATPNPDFLHKNASPAEVMELRLVLEPIVVDMAVRRASQQQISFMQHCLDQAEKAEHLEIFEHWDDMLHRTIAESTRNMMFISVYEMISIVRRQGEWGKLKERTLTDEQRKLHMDEHVRIVEAIRQRDPAAARREMERHLEHIQESMFETGLAGRKANQAA